MESSSSVSFCKKILEQVLLMDEFKLDTLRNRELKEIVKHALSSGPQVMIFGRVIATINEKVTTLCRYNSIVTVLLKSRSKKL